MERPFALLSLCSGKQDKEVAGKASNEPVVQQQQQHHYIPEENEEGEDNKASQEVVVEKSRDKTAVGRQHYIPEDVINVILSKLPVKAILRFKCVCKLWRSLISDPKFDFSTKGRQRTIIRCEKYGANGERVVFYSMEEDDELLPYLPGPIRPLYDNLKFFGSCDGLLLFCNTGSNSLTRNVILGNPTTGCWRELPQFNGLAKASYRRTSSQYACVTATGLCFDESSDDYKAVSIDAYSRVLVVSLRKGIIWEDISFPYEIGLEGVICDRFGGSMFLERSTAGVLAHGHLHWIAKEKIGGSGSSSGSDSDLIVYFDQKLNKFDTLPMPDEHVNVSETTIYTINSLQVVDGCLCMVRTAGTRFGQMLSRDVLILKEYGVKEGWTRLDGLRGFAYLFS